MCSQACYNVLVNGSSLVGDRTRRHAVLSLITGRLQIDYRYRCRSVGGGCRL